MDVLIYMHLSVRLSIDKMLTKLAKIIVKITNFIGEGFLKMVDRRFDKTSEIITKIKNNNYNKNYWE
jgi:hypothetical protein